MIKKDPSLRITVCYHSASLVMPNSDPQDNFFLSDIHTHDGFLYSYYLGDEKAEVFCGCAVLLLPSISQTSPLTLVENRTFRFQISAFCLIQIS